MTHDNTRSLDQIRADLRQEVGPTGGISGDRDGQWQPWVTAHEIWALLDALDAADAQQGDAATGADPYTLGRAYDGFPRHHYGGPVHAPAAPPAKPRPLQPLPNPAAVHACPRRWCRGRTPHNLLAHWLGWARR